MNNFDLLEKHGWKKELVEAAKQISETVQQNSHCIEIQASPDWPSSESEAGQQEERINTAANWDI